MRITNNMLMSNMMRNLNNNLRRLDKYQTQMSTGKRIQKPSDDPVRASRALRLRTDLSRLEQYEKNSDNALSWIEITESAVAEVGDVLGRARELTVRAATGTLGTDDKQKIADEMKQLKEQLISSGNTNYAGRYIFSGYKTDSQLFDKDGNYNIDITSSTLKNKPTTSVEIGVGEEIQVSTNGLDIFQYEEIDTLLGKLPFGEATGTAATQGELVADSAFNLNADFSTGAGDAEVKITIDGNSYTVNNTDLASLDGTNTTKQDIVNLINNAENGGIRLRDVGEAYINIEGKIVIQNESYGTGSSIQVDYIGDSGGGLNEADLAAAFGIPNGSTANGADSIETSIEGTETFTNADITNEAFEGTEFIVEYNGEEKRVTLGPLATDDLGGLIDSINAALDTEFTPGSIVASTVDNGGGNFSIKFETQNSPNDGTKPQLSVDVVRANESTLLKDFDEAIASMNVGDEGKIGEFLGKLDNHINRILSVRSDIGSRVNRMELIQDRIGKNNLTYTDLLSKNEDADMAEVIMNLKNQENVYRASLSAGARVIQPTLIDFIR